MKLRLKHNSIRLRLTQSEVSLLADGGPVEESIDFPGGQKLSYRLVPVDDAEIGAVFRDSALTISVPQITAGDWADGDEVGLSTEIDAEGKTLAVLIEKDFTCLKTRAGGDDDDTFPHPDAK